MDAIKETEKCILICSNCHKELHDNLWTINELNLEKKEEVDLEFDA
jgi:predicted HNH restriction endonuclease